MSKQTTDNRSYDVAVIGGGPAGITAAIWCADLGLSCFLADAGETPGGQLGWIQAAITNYPGAITNNGAEMAKRFAESLSERIVVRSNTSVTSIKTDPLSMRMSDGDSITATSMIVATGVRRRTLGIAGESEFTGRGILTSGAGSKGKLSGKRVVIVGGGDAALENACILSEVADRVTVVHRRESFAAREGFLEKLNDRDNVEFRMLSELTSINGDAFVRSVTCRSIDSGLEELIDADAVLIRIGVEPNSDLVTNLVDLDSRGYVVADRTCVTSLPDIFAIGDVSNPIAPTIAGAVGDAATAVKAAYSLLFASKRL